MPKVARIVAPGMPHHITQRGNLRENVFFEEQDYALYKKPLVQYAARKLWPVGVLKKPPIFPIRRLI